MYHSYIFLFLFSNGVKSKTGNNLSHSEFLLGHATKTEAELRWNYEYDLDKLIYDMMS